MAPHLQDLAIAGPLSVTGVSETPEPAQDLHLSPDRGEPGARCAGDILRRLATQAYRGPVRDDVDDLLSFYDRARNDGGDFEDGIRFGIQGILANPALHVPDRADASARRTACIASTDVDLASRLSFFMWGTLPDEALLKVATDGDAQESGGVRPAGEADARRPAIARARHALRVAVAAAAGRRQGSPRRPPVPAVGRDRCPRRSSAKPSSSSTASSAKTAARSI